jgi:1-acyl-sn-glycerol-3-phosphate acyltransferase
MKKENTFYIPDTGIRYPDNPEEHVFSRLGSYTITLDEHYPFYDKSPAFRLKSALMHLGIFCIVFPLNRIRFDLKIEGKDILKKHKELLKNGALTVANHIHRWDFLMILHAVRRRLHFPAWKENLSGPDRNLIRLAGGIPVPSDIKTIKYFNKALDDLVAEKKWLHVFPESARWDYYPYIRPFKKGMFSMAYKYNLPVLPMAFSFRPATGIFKLFKKKLPLITLRIGEPLLPDLSKSRKEAVTLLRRQCHDSITALAAIPNNPWQPEAD